MLLSSYIKNKQKRNEINPPSSAANFLCLFVDVPLRDICTKALQDLCAESSAMCGLADSSVFDVGLRSAAGWLHRCASSGECEFNAGSLVGGEKKKSRGKREAFV